MGFLRSALLSLAALLMTVTVVALIAGLWLFYTTPGAAWVVHWAVDQEPRLELKVTAGSLAEGLDVEALHWRDEQVDVRVETASVRWKVRCFLNREVCLRHLRADRVQVDVLEEEGPVQRPEVPLEERGLPELELPVPVSVEQLRVRYVEIAAGDVRERLERLEARFAAQGTRWDIQRLRLERTEGWLEADGSVFTEGAYPLTLNVRAQVSPPGVAGTFRTVVRAGGDVQRLRVNGHLGGMIAGDLELDLRPLTQGLPYRLRARNVEAGWPLETRETIAVEGLSLDASGDLEGAVLDLETRLRGEHVPEGRWRADGRVDRDRLELDELEVEALGGRADGRAELQWPGRGGAETLSWRVEAVFDDVSPGRFWEHAPEHVSGPARAGGSVGPEGWSLDVRTEGLEGRLRDQAAEVRGAVEREFDGDWVFTDVVARVPSGEGRVDGRLGAEWDLEGTVRAEDLAQVHPDAAGRIAGRARVRGTPGRLDVETAGEGSALAWKEYHLASLEWDGRLVEGGHAASELEVRLQEARFEDWTVGDARIRGRGSESLHMVEAEVRERDYAARLAVIGGLREREAWDGMLTEARVAWDDPNTGEHALAVRSPFPIAWGPDGGFVSAHCWDYRAAELCLEEDAEVGPERGAVALAARGLELEWLEPWLPEAAEVDGAVQAQARAGWNGGDWNVEASAESPGGRLAWTIREDDEDEFDEPEVRELFYHEVRVTADYRPERLEAGVTVDTEEAGRARVTAVTDPRPGQRGLDGRVELEGLRLGFFRPFAPELRELQGEVFAEGDVGGTWSDPRYNGYVALEDGRVAGPDWPLTLESLELLAEIEGDQADLSGGFRSGDGRARLTGEAAWREDDWSVAVELDGEGLEVRQPPWVEATAEPSLRLRVEPGAVTVRGGVDIPRGSVTVQELPQRAVTHSRDVVVVRRNEAPEAAEEVALPEGWRLDVDIEIGLGDAITLSGYGVRGRLGGALRVRLTPETGTEAFGEIRIDDGLYQAYGQRLTIRRGLFLFTGPADRPTMEVEAVRSIPRDRVVAGVRVEGPVDEPVVTLFSEPPMSQEDALSYLIRGRPMGADGPGGDELLAQAALALGVYGGGGAAAAFAERVGIQDFEIEATGEGDTAQVLLSGFLTPRIYVAYGVGVFESVNTLTLRYHMTYQLYLEAVSGVENALDLMYRFEID